MRWPSGSEELPGDKNCRRPEWSSNWRRPPLTHKQQQLECPRRGDFFGARRARARARVKVTVRVLFIVRAGAKARASVTFRLRLGLGLGLGLG